MHVFGADVRMLHSVWCFLLISRIVNFLIRPSFYLSFSLSISLIFHRLIVDIQNATVKIEKDAQRIVRDVNKEADMLRDEIIQQRERSLQARIKLEMEMVRRKVEK